MKTAIAFALILIISACGSQDPLMKPNVTPTRPSGRQNIVPPFTADTPSGQWGNFDLDCTHQVNKCQSRVQLRGEDFVLSMRVNADGSFGGHVSDYKLNVDIHGPSDLAVQKYSAEFRTLGQQDYRYSAFGPK